MLDFKICRVSWKLLLLDAVCGNPYLRTVAKAHEIESCAKSAYSYKFVSKGTEFGVSCNRDFTGIKTDFWSVICCHIRRNSGEARVDYNPLDILTFISDGV